MSTPEIPESKIAQLWLVFKQTRERDPRMLPLMAAFGLGALAVFVVIGLVTGDVVLWSLVGVLVGLLAAIQVFSRRAQRLVFSNLEGKPGAATAVLERLRAPWRVTPAIAMNRRQDFVHLAVGRPGVVLVAEGGGARTTAMLRQEARRLGRVIGDAPIHEIRVGDGDGEVALSQLSLKLMRLPRSLKKGEVAALAGRLESLGSQRPPMPKGPIPRGRPR